METIVDLVLFDLDKTLLSGDSDYAWGEFLIHRGIVRDDDFKARNLAFYEAYQAGTLDIYAYLEFQLEPLSRNSRARLQELQRDFMSSVIRPMITDKAKDLVRHHLQRDALVVVVTATNTFVTAPIVREFGIHHLIGTVAAQENGRFTGKVRGLPAFQKGKIARVEDWLESIGQSFDAFENTWFYSDSLNDVPLLERVSRPVAVDPDPNLRTLAESRGWEIISLR